MIERINPFIAIVDKYGDVVNTMSAKSVIDEVFSILRHLDFTEPEYAPHLAYEWKDGYFARVDDIHPTSIAARVSKSQKVKIGFSK